MLWRIVKNLSVHAVIIVVMQMDVAPVMVCIVFPASGSSKVGNVSLVDVFSPFF